MQVNKTQLGDEHISCNASNCKNSSALVLPKANRLRKLRCQDLSSQYESVILGGVARRGRDLLSLAESGDADVKA